MTPRQAPGTWRTRLLWLLVLWAAGVGALSIVTAALKLVMRAAGLGG